LKEKNRYDQIPPGIFDRLQRILPLAEKVAEEIVCDETDILEEIIPRMFKVMRNVAEFSCEYVRRGRLGGQSSSYVGQILMIAARTVSGLAHQRAIEGMESDLTKVTEDFDRAVNVEALRRIKETGEPSSYASGDSSF